MTVDEALRIQGEVRGLQHDDVRQAALDVLADEVRRMTLLLDDERSDFTALAEHHAATMLQLDRPKAQLAAIAEEGTSELNAAVELRQELAQARLERDALKADQQDWRKGVELIASALGDPAHDLSCVRLNEVALVLRAERDALKAQLAASREEGATEPNEAVTLRHELAEARADRDDYWSMIRDRSRQVYDLDIRAKAFKGQIASLKAENEKLRGVAKEVLLVAPVHLTCPEDPGRCVWCELVGIAKAALAGGK
jgi:chromosome segregation ATPase